MKREFLDYIEDIIEAMGNASEFIRGMEYEDFEKDVKTVYAVVRALEIIGEAVKKIPDEVKNKYPQIPWRDVAGMRDKLIHEYFGVDVEILWKTAKDDIPPLKQVIQNMMKGLEK